MKNESEKNVIFDDPSGICSSSISRIIDLVFVSPRLSRRTQSYPFIYFLLFYYSEIILDPLYVDSGRYHHGFLRLYSYLSYVGWHREKSIFGTSVMQLVYDVNGHNRIYATTTTTEKRKHIMRGTNKQTQKSKSNFISSGHNSTCAWLHNTHSHIQQEKKQQKYLFIFRLGWPALPPLLPPLPATQTTVQKKWIHYILWQ